MSNISFLGLGAMGSRMARHLLNSEHSVCVWNRSPKACLPLQKIGAKTAATAADAVIGADLVISMIADDSASKTLWLDPTSGILANLAPETLAIECSTLSPTWVKSLSLACRSHKVHFVDAPVAGSRPQADLGQLIFLAGGSKEAIDKANPVLSIMGKSVLHCGANGSGSIIKLAINSLLCSQVAALAELIQYLDKSHIELAKAIDIINQTAVASPALQGAAKSIIERDFSANFPISLALKDLHYTENAASELGIYCPITTATRKQFTLANAKDLGTLNLTAVSQVCG